MGRHLARSYAVANLEDIPATVPASAKEKKRKRTADETASEGDDSPDAVPSPPKPKRGRPPGPAKAKPAVVPKAGKEPANSAVGMGGPKAVIVRGKVLPPRSPLPARAGRNVNPGKVAAPNTRKTSAEVAVIAKRKADLQRQVDELEQQRIEKLAEMELQEELDDEAEERSVVRKLGEASSLDDTEDIEMQSEEGEVVDPSVAEAGSEVAAEDDSDEATRVKKAAPKGKQRKKKAARGETRAAVDQVKESMKAAGKKRKASAEPETTSDRKKTKASFPSGLVSNWQSKVSAPSKASSKAKVSGLSSGNTVPLGGLDDEDASATFAPPPKLKGTERNINRKNNFVAVDSASEDDVEIIPTKKSKVKPKTVKKSATTTLEVKPIAKSKPRSALAVPKPKLNRTSPAVDISLATSDINTLPEFARSAWSTSFLPTLYSRLGSAPSPFVIDTDMVNAVQEAVEIVYPDSDYQVRLNDRIFTLAKDRLNEKRTFFGRQGLKIVTEFFQGDAYANKPTEIAKYAKWAIRGNGPALFGKPTPITCTLKKGEDGYIEEKDIFESKFIIQLLTPFLKSCQGSCHDYGRPVGALGMAATGIERAFLMNTTGVRVNKGQFSRDVVGALVEDYVYNATVLSERRWKIIKTLCGAHTMEQKPDVYSIPVNRRALYVPSSPVKESDNE